ncbi:MAG: glycosyltransferase [Caldilineales bacterium]|nr:glycosyltransferase [Caldilineales bacterium]
MDDGSGGPIAARRLHTALRQAGHDSRMLVWRKTTDDPTIELFGRSKLSRAASQGLGEPLDALGLQYLAHPASWALPDHPWIRAADVVHLHIIHGGYFSPLALPRLSRATPVLWTMHDLWAVTGHCAVAAYDECQRWQEGCGACPQLHDYPAIRFDTTRWLWRLKRSLYQRSPRLAIACPSAWMANKIRQSPLLHHLDPIHLPNGIDLTLFKPLPQAVAREALGIDRQLKVLMISSPVLSNARKGMPLLVQALQGLDPAWREHLLLLVVGKGGQDLAAQLPGFRVKSMGMVSDEIVSVLCYNAADIFVFPSIAENLPNSLLESIACGTPVVCYDVGGNCEIVEHGITGFVAQKGDIAQFRESIQAILDDKFDLQESSKSVNRIKNKYDIEMIAQRSIGIYNDLVSSN